jgi:hypothetical protein
VNEEFEMSQTPLEKILELLNRLDKAKIHYRLAHNQEDAISIEVAVPGQRWEIDCYSNGVIDVEVFKSDGSVRDGSAIDDLFRDFAD